MSIMLWCKKLRLESKVCKKCKTFPVGDLQMGRIQIVNDEK
jgi:hypothetical protein